MRLVYNAMIQEVNERKIRPALAPLYDDFALPEWSYKVDGAHVFHAWEA